LIVVDDALLFAVISGRSDDVTAPYLAAAGRNELFTTSSWYWRLSRAVAHGERGALSRPFQALSETDRRRVALALADLPSGIGMLNLRNLVPVMAALPGQLNFLTAEAVAAAVMLDAGIAVTTDSDPLVRSAAAAGISVEVVRFESAE